MEQKWYKITFNHNQVMEQISFKKDFTFSMITNSNRDFFMNNFIKKYDSKENNTLYTHYCFPPVFFCLCSELIKKYNGIPFSIENLPENIILENYIFASY